MRSTLTWIALAAGCLACSPTRPYISEHIASRSAAAVPAEAELFYSVFLIGDGGESAGGPAPSALPLLKRKSTEAGSHSAIVFLGDNIYPKGLPPPGAPGRSQAERQLLSQLNAVKDHTGRVFMIPGNHDWNNGNAGGLEAIKRQEVFVETYLDRGNVFLPDNGFPGPVDIELVDDDDTPFDKDIRLIVMDTEWWLFDHEKPYGDTGEYELQDAGDFLLELQHIMRDRLNDHVIVAAHHPLYSNGSHGGHFPLKTHVTPPLVGTLYVLYRKFFGLRQDITHYRYQEMKRELDKIFSEKEDLVYASGHEHNLQYFNITGKRQDQHFIVSGAASDTDFAAAGMGADFVYRGTGFTVVRYYSDGSVWFEAWSPEKGNPDGKLWYHTRLIAPDEDPFHTLPSDSDTGPYPDYSDSTVTIAANPDYDKPGTIYRALLGSHNRDFWSIPVEVPVFDIARTEGGLEAIKLGGKGQSLTLRLRNSRGREFVLRSTDKIAGKTWEDHLKNTLAHDLAQDQFSILNPYGAYLLPPLAEAVGIYHTNPRLYLIPDDPRLGEFGKEMAGKLALFEERPDDDMSHAPHLGGSEEVISTRAMLSETEADLDHQVDQRMMVLNRLFDIWIADWDRHEDQWRWASYEPFELDTTLTGDARTEGKIYRPIPRDRDLAFFRMNGLIPTVGKYTSFKNYQDFRVHYGNLKGLTMNSLALSRRFTNELTRNEWLVIAEEMKNALTDNVIERAVAHLPEPVYRAKGEWMSNHMKARREQLPEVALEYYELLSRVVDVVGSTKDEYVRITGMDGGKTEVAVYKRNDKPKERIAYYRRVFINKETEEVRIYGLGGDDKFEISGEIESSMLVRIIGGSGSDRYLGNTKSPVRQANVKLYDTVGGNVWSEADAFDLRLAENALDHKYEYKSGFGYNTSTPLLFFGHNKDDGTFVGGGITFTNHGFRKHPQASVHKLRANVAAKTGAFNAQYDGRFTGIAGSWDGKLEISGRTPNNIRNFLGLGNETRETIAEDDYYKARLQQYRFATALERRLSTRLTLSAGPHFQITEVRKDAGRFISQPQAGISPDTFEDQWFSGVNLELFLTGVDSDLNPRQGFRWNSRAELNLGIRNTSDTYGALGSVLSMYLSPTLNPQLTLATRVGFHHNIGPFPFYSANALGGTRNLRGLRSTRYNGRTSFYNNIELRGKLFDFSSYLLGGEFGWLGFLDHGRVWTDGERSDAWHVGYGGGVWMSLFRMTLLRASIGVSEDEWNLLAGAGFFF